MGLLKFLYVKISIFMLITRALILKQYVLDCVSTGSASTLYANPNILTAFYTLMTAAATAIQTAVNVANLAPTTGNKKAIRDRMDDAKDILKEYAVKVETIANDPANASTREEVSTNISQSHLTPQKLKSSKKGNPDTPTFTAKNIGTERVEVVITNGVDYKPTTIVVIAVEQPVVVVPAVADPTATLTRGQMIVQSSVAIQVITLTLNGKGQLATFDTLKSGVSYKIYGYAKNGNLQISLLSAGVLVKG